MAGSITENPTPQDPTVISDGSKTTQSDVVTTVDSYTIMRTVEEDFFVAFDAQNTGGEQQFLHMEAHAAKDGNPSYYTAYWDGSAPLNDFLTQTDAFFNRYSMNDPEHINDVGLVISGDEGMMPYGGERPITAAELVEAEGKRIGTDAERLRFLRIENSLAAFTWEPTRTGFIVTPSRYPEDADLQKSLVDIYIASSPVVPTPVFQGMLGIVTPENAS